VSLHAGTWRQNIVKEIRADIFDVEQSTISRVITSLTPLVEQATEESRPTAKEAAEATKGTIALVDSMLWSWDGESKLWSGKYKTAYSPEITRRL
jgi:arginine repressor